jgi:predicted hydrocarbon binding protein/KaiC/GvpD/RAD55 family RecA-like ATPase
MAERAASLAEIADVPTGSLILVTGPPGAGKSDFSHQVVLNGLAMERPVIFATTEQGPAEITDLLREKGMGELPPGSLNFVDAFAQTVGLSTPGRPDTVHASCEDLNSLSMGIARLQQRVGRKEILLAFDSLTSPYLFSKDEMFRFMRLCLLKFAAEGNSVVALVDEGCGKAEDLVAMMSVADGVIKMEMGEDEQLLNLVKHPKARATRIQIPIEPERMGLAARIFDPSVLRDFIRAMALGGGAVMRQEVGDFVNLFWPNFAHWSGMLWDPKRFPMMTYEFNKEDGPALMRLCREDEAVGRAFFPWRKRILLKVLFPESFSKVGDMRKILRWPVLKAERSGAVEYLEDVSTTDEHTFRVYENCDCWGFENVGAPMASHLPPLIAGGCMGFEYWKGLERDWNAIETKCIGLGDPYCEFKLVPGEIAELRGSLEKDVSAIERIHERLMDQLMGFLLEAKPLAERPTLGTDVHLHVAFHAMAFPALAGQRYRMALRMGGARSGKEVGERLIDSGLSDDEALKRVIGFLEHCKVGKVTLGPRSGQVLGETIRIRENCESSQTRLFATKIKQPSCYFTTGFFNGLFSAVKNQHVREVKCIAAGDPYCEWEILS